jgi:GH25 family lysozyme M1 (1,4-beta-N-acetylmuramidase)
VPDTLERQLDPAATRLEGYRVPAQPGLAGIDIWSGNGAVEWKKVKKAAVAFAYIRAAYGDCADSRAKEYLEGARAAGVKVGVYHFLRAKNYQAQIDLMLKLLDSLAIGKGDLPPALDVEDNPTYDGPWNPAENDRFCSALAMWVEAVQKKTGAPPVIYTRADFWATLGNPAGFGNCPLWIASYRDGQPTIPQGWHNYTFWQYSGKGKVDGVSAGTDLSRFFSSDRAALENVLLK